jgi:hypothetical protein
MDTMKHLLLQRLPLILPLLFSSACFDNLYGEDSADSKPISGTPRGPLAPSMPALVPAGPGPSCAHRISRAPQLPANVLPLDLLDLGEVGFCPEDSVRVRFASGSQIIEVAAVSASPLKFVAPLWLDPKSGRPIAAELTLSLIGPVGGSTFAESLRVQGLIAGGSAALGQATITMLEGTRIAVARSRRDLVQRAGAGNTADAALVESLETLNLLSSAILELRRTGVSFLRVPLVGGGELGLDRDSLAVLDAVCSAYLERLTPRTSPSVDKSGSTGQLRQAQTEALDLNWHDDLVEATARGELELVEMFSARTGMVLTVLGAAFRAGAPYFAATAGLTFGVTLILPAAAALILNVGTRAIQGNLEGHAWEATRGPLRYIVNGALGDRVSDAISSFIEPTTEFGAAAVSLIDTYYEGTGNLIEQGTDWLFGEDGSRAVPDDDFPVVNGASGGNDPDEPTAPEEPEGEEEEGEEPPAREEPAPEDNISCSTPTPCLSNLSVLRSYCINFDKSLSWYEVGGARVQCGDFRNTEQVIACDERADDACAS